jgi:hypothetical protein
MSDIIKTYKKAYQNYHFLFFRYIFSHSNFSLSTRESLFMTKDNKYENSIKLH